MRSVYANLMTPDTHPPQQAQNQPQIQPQAAPQPQVFGAANQGQIGGAPGYQPQTIAVGQAPLGMMQPAFASTSATAALVLSILGLLGGFCYGIGFIFLIISIILCVGNGKVIKENPMHPDRGTHKAAVIINWIAAIVIIVSLMVVGAGVLYVWSSSLAEGSTDGQLSLYYFDATDASGDVTSGYNDDLIIITMESGSDLSWAVVQIQISIDGDAPITCDNPGQSGSQCGAVEFGNTGDNVWSVGDGVTIVESGSNLCSDGCDIEFTILDAREGMIVDTGYAYAY